MLKNDLGEGTKHLLSLKFLYLAIQEAVKIVKEIFMIQQIQEID